MPWNNQGGSGGPWGSGPSGGGSGRGSMPPDLESFLKKNRDRFQKMMPGRGGNFRYLPLILGGFLFFWISSGFYVVQEGERGAVLRFGAWVRTTGAGINYHLPSPIETVIVRKVDQINRIDSGVALLNKQDVLNLILGSQSPEESGNSGKGDNDNLMLTGDENIISVNFTVHWFIKDIGSYLFKVVDPDATVKRAAESAVREIIAQTPMIYAITKGRGDISDRSQAFLQQILDRYEAGIQIQRVQLKSVDPPSQVIAAFRDVQQARTDRESEINEAKAYASKIVPEARGQGKKIVKEAQAYQAAQVQKAKGRTARYLSLLQAYQGAPEVTRIRLQIDTVQKVLQGTQKMILTPDAIGGSGVLPYLPLDMLKAKGSQNQKKDLQGE